MSASRVLRHLALGLAAAGVALVILDSRSVASLFGEENLTLGEILVQSIKQTEELRAITNEAARATDLVGNLVDSYQRVNAGIEELEHYSVESFLHDFKEDIYHLYPALAKIEHGGAKLRRWDGTHTSSPFTAYEAISAVAGDLTQPLRDDIKAGRRSIDRELILQTEAAGGFALADAAETSTKTYDAELGRLRAEYARKANPGTAMMVAAHTNLILAEQNSQIIRLLSRAVRLDGVDKALRAGDQLSGLKEAYRRDEAVKQVAKETLQPPQMIRFDE